jgi:hypothetical protein
VRRKETATGPYRLISFYESLLEQFLIAEGPLNKHTLKVQTDKAMEGNFNRIVISILALVAILLLVSVLVFHKTGSTGVPTTPRQPAAQQPEK